MNLHPNFSLPLLEKNPTRLLNFDNTYFQAFYLCLRRCPGSWRGTRGFPKADNGSEGGVTGGRDLEAGGIREGP